VNTRELATARLLDPDVALLAAVVVDRRDDHALDLHLGAAWHRVALDVLDPRVVATAWAVGRDRVVAGGAAARGDRCEDEREEGQVTHEVQSPTRIRFSNGAQLILRRWRGCIPKNENPPCGGCHTARSLVLT